MATGKPAAPSAATLTLKPTPAAKLPKPPSVPSELAAVVETLRAERNFCEVQHVEARPGGGVVAVAHSGEVDVVLASDPSGAVVRADVPRQNASTNGGRAAVSVDPTGRWALDAGPEFLHRIDLQTGDVSAVWPFDVRGACPNEAVWIAGGRVLAATERGLHVLAPRDRDAGTFERVDHVELPNVFWHIASSPDGLAVVATAFGDDRYTDKPEVRVYAVAHEDVVLAASVKDKAEAPFFRGERCFAKRGRATVEIEDAYGLAKRAAQHAAAEPHRTRVASAISSIDAGPISLVAVDEAETRPELPESARAALRDNPFAFVQPLGDGAAALAGRIDADRVRVTFHRAGEAARVVEAIPEGRFRPLAVAPGGDRFLVGHPTQPAPLHEVAVPSLAVTSSGAQKVTLGAAYTPDPARLLWLRYSELWLVDRASWTFVAEVPVAGMEMVFAAPAQVALVRTVECQLLAFGIRGDDLVAYGALPGPALALRERAGRVFVDHRGTWCEVRGLERLGAG